MAEKYPVEAEHCFRHLAVGTPNAVVCANHKGEIKFWNPAAERLFGYLCDEAMRMNLDAIVPREQRLRHVENFQHAIKTRSEGDVVTQQIETEVSRSDGSVFPAHMSLSIWTEAGRLYLGIIIRDISAYRSVQDRLSRTTWHDTLTGLSNRAELLRQLDQAVVRRRSGALVLIDLRNFTEINQTHGYSFGDHILRLTGKAIATCLCADDLIARWGGDEFCVYLPGRTKVNEIITLCNQVEENIQEIDRKPGRLSANVGVAVFPEDADQVEALIAHADLAVVQAMQDNIPVRFFDSQMSKDANARQRYKSRLDDALAREEFEVFYQPQFCTVDQSLTGAEALIRWRHPEDGLVMPDVFLPILEDSALAIAVGHWVLATACAQANQWRADYKPDFRVGVNLFAKQLEVIDFEATVRNVLAETSLPPSGLELEITENIVLHSHETVITQLRNLREAGVSIAFDDYGTGYASLSLLKRYPLSRLKIDRSFVSALESNAEDRALVQAVLDLGSSFNLRVIAEGVETSEQLELLRRAECEEAQGYLMSKPVPAHEFERRFLEAG